MYQAGVEAIMGFRLLGTTLVIDPCILRAWTGNEIDFRYHSARYEIVVDNPQGVSRGVASIELDGHVGRQGYDDPPRRLRRDARCASFSAIVHDATLMHQYPIRWRRGNTAQDFRRLQRVARGAQ